MTANEWVEKVANKAGLPWKVIYDMWGLEIEEFLINAENEKEYNETLDQFVDDIKLEINKLIALREAIEDITYEEVKN